MPYTEKQRKLMNAAAHDPEIAEQHGMSHRDAAGMADEANRMKKEGKERKPVRKADNFIDLHPILGTKAGG